MAVDRLSQTWATIKRIAVLVLLVMLAAAIAEDTFIRYRDKVWTIFSSSLRSLWSDVISFFAHDELKLYIVGTFILTTGVFWLSNLFFILLDLTGWPACILTYKIQPEKNRPLLMTDFLKALKVALFNQIFVGIPVLSCTVSTMRWMGSTWSAEELPSVNRVLLELAVFAVVEEIGFYYSHRLLHHPRLYKYIHKKHHEWTAPVGIVSIYAHPVEHVFANLVPPGLGPILMGSHLFTAWLFWAIAIVSTTIDHSGYRLPVFLSPDFHDFHHLKFNTNYGVLGILDRLHGTDALFRKHTLDDRDTNPKTQ
ncbi:fatty acid hydroxylase domain-containing protein 2 [Biomphalaria glabrata]|nr:fatty acid hydroxylase domain-containing protein 2 [Biomphalaria glabrata]